MTSPPHPFSGHGQGITPDDLYLTPPPWDLGRPQPAFLALVEAGAIAGRVVDVGCGTGEHVLMCADQGLTAVGIDLAASALRIAETKAKERHLSARFLKMDARNLAELGEHFNIVLDCGLFHIFSDEDRAVYADSLSSIVMSGGRYFMLALSDQEPAHFGGRMRHVRQEEIAATFADRWQVDFIEPAKIEITTDPAGVRAWLAGLTRR
jgi:ubiquinone/menaquinone biosynthesis C-methylase UbiE